VTSGIDLWRAIDPEARLLSGSVDRLRTAVRGVAHTRAAPPHLPLDVDGQLLVVDSALLGTDTALDRLVSVLDDAGLQPVAVVLAALPSQAPAPDRAGDPLPILGSAMPLGVLADAAARHLEHADDEIGRMASELRLAAAEAALVTPDPGAAAGLVAGRLRRGVAVAADGELLALHARPAGRALAARFAALHARLLADSPGRSTSRQATDGLFLIERRIRTGASVWLFDDLPFARIDEAGAEALTITLRALLRRPADVSVTRVPPRGGVPATRPGRGAAAQPGAAPAGDATLDATILAVARANGVDPRRADDALAILRRAEESADRP